MAEQNEPATELEPTDEAGVEASISDPAELLRLLNMFQALTTEVRDLELDDAGRHRLADIQRRAVGSLKEAISDDLEHELDDLGLPIEDGAATGAELRLSQAQLLGWLNGLFQGVQAAVMAQQRSAAQQLQSLQQEQQGPQLSRSGSGGQYL